MHLTYKHTMYASFMGFVVQAIINNFAPLLFLTFHNTYGISMGKITFLVTFNFLFQLMVDLLAPGIVERIGQRAAVTAANFFSALGLVGLAFLPGLFTDPFHGLVLAVTVYAVGGGLLEVLLSPIVEACPNENKEAAMSLLHAFYCWGVVAVVLLSTVFFTVFGIEKWRILAVLWAILPLANALMFWKVPLAKLLDDGDRAFSVKELLGQRLFWVMILLMFCAGASEQSVSQWASTFAEQGLGVSKTLGDLAGPMLFAVLMGASRTMYSRVGERLNIRQALTFSAVLCLASYLLIALSPWPWLSLLGCGICGFSVGLLWPGSLSLSASRLRRGGTAMFAYLALAGDLGCSLGPTLVGEVSSLAGDDLKAGILAAIVFPVLLLVGVGLCRVHTAE